jgi:peptide-methionine (S)-S-oxide reductase
MKKLLTVLLFAPLLAIAGCETIETDTVSGILIQPDTLTIQPLVEINPEGLSTAYFASGCFWCVEAIYESVKGVSEAVSGYSGGVEENPTYHNLGTHTETVKVLYDSSIIDFPTLIKVYYGSQDATTIGQSPDFGAHYRSVIFYQNVTEQQLAQKHKTRLGELNQYIKPIVTEIKEFEVFYEAEAYHQNYERLNPEQSYVKGVSIPRLNKFKEKFPELLKAK